MNDKDLEINEEQGENLTANSEPSEKTEAVEAAEPVSALQKQVEELKEESRRNYDSYLRARAELENIKKRAIREREDYIKFATLPMIKKLLPIIDDLDRALSTSNTQQDYEILSKGVEMIARSLHEMIKHEGVEAIEAVGRPFDPQFHQPLSVEGSSGHPENTVIEEFQKGYIMHGRVIRPSLVKVSN
ncbi:MAG: nucleotide exchange factor GrpE [Syntrophomonas sp.]